MDSGLLPYLINEIDNSLSKLGLMYRIFGRIKTPESLEKKIKKFPGKYGAHKKIQDALGVRIALYFADDVDVVCESLKESFEYVDVDSQIDSLEVEIFKAVRCNLMFKLPDRIDIASFYDDRYASIVDGTFEIQIRTIFSEGWHEVDHDLRYKCAEDWVGLDKENRTLNGVYATLETCEWTLLKLFEDISYGHYKENNIRAMLNNKFRLRFIKSPTDEKVMEYIGNQPNLLKSIFRYDRSRALDCLSKRRRIPISQSALIFIMNLDYIKDIGLAEIMPENYSKWWEAC